MTTTTGQVPRAATTPGTHRTHTHRSRRTGAVVAALLLGALPLTACGQDVPAAPGPGEASTGVPLNVGSEDPAATSTASVAP